MKRSIFLTLLSSMLVLSLMSCGKDHSKEEKSTYHNVFLLTPEVTQTGENVKTFPALVEEARNISVAFKTPGQIVKIYAKEGDHVSAGQTLALLDTVDYALGVRQLRSQYAQQKAELERKRQLHASGNMSDNEFERASASLHQLGLQLQLNENKLKYCRLKSPASGVITKRNFETAEMVDAGTPVFELMDNSHLEVVVDLPVGNYVSHADFMTFTGHTPHAEGVDIPLSLLSITPKADNNQLYRMKLLMAKASDKLTPGMNITVDIASNGNSSEGTVVPLSSVFERDGQTAVWSFNNADSTVVFTPVKISGNGSNGYVTITEGLKPGIAIVRAGAHHLTDGEKVNVITENSTTNPGNLL